MGPRPHQALQVLLTAFAVVGALVGLQLRPEVVLTAGTPTERVSALRQVVDLPSPKKATRDFYATGCGLSTRYCVLRSGSRPHELVDDVVQLLVDKGARPVDGRCPHGKRVEATDCSRRVVLNGVGLLVTAGNEVGSDSRVPTFATVLLAEDPTPQVGPSAPLASLALLGLQPAGDGAAPCVERRGVGCARYEGAFRAPGTVPGLASVWRARLVSLGYRIDDDRCNDQGCLLAASRFRTFGGQDPMSVVVSLADAGAGQVLQRLTVSVPPVTTP